MSKGESGFKPVNAVVVTVSDTRTEETDSSGRFLQQSLTDAGHQVLAKHIVKDDTYKLRALVATLIADDQVQAVLLTGGTGFTHRDNTVKAVTPLLDMHIDGFGEIFRYLSHAEIGSSTIQSRAFAGISNGTIVFCMPGSTGACRTAWEGIIAQQLDSRHKPCHFVDKLKTVA
ncbi:molybdenum cofactor biosynthesis protein B [Pseudohongiella sp. SYSU M77423]|uniref:molybdenum cofactor biosynthesis protein B n=1 Tax=unclassified Pseudohongiella TaxID=2629611 RepID=UPI000C9950E6|nr:MULTISPECIES: molybdenum cofactor biosynthesis protein B [unclassified Pseudohongiella]MAY56338.1 molybdenum cofactor biosynthesis protein B [Gammaproteobacteria bacterium]MDH7943009.1 molybdenum cofactor biosynthesis protein B [Pseudohongiella sp. SYSU M77423]HBN16360.1 molybdenum cofactor biosynthesis protein B [Pseudohongiella sp.]|tara:strand:- start:148 stop:666 length:519 start_codon:yes stop_codon:yes gene_type:complete